MSVDKMLSHADSKASPSFMYEVVSSALMKWDPCTYEAGSLHTSEGQDSGQRKRLVSGSQKCQSKVWHY